ncbi:MAG: disulfide oxidoreductase [Patescibacteria group bacterium]
MNTPSWISKNSLYFAWAIALVATVGSLYFSEIAGYAPCLLCWYQRIFMYPLVIVLGVGLLRRDRAVALYALPLSLIGLGIALYHNLLQWHIISESLAPCREGISCVDNPVIALNFITIPLISLTAFVLISVLMFIYHSDKSHA